MIKGVVIIAHADHMNITHDPATKHISQRVARQMIRITQCYDVKQFKHIDGDKNIGGDGIRRLPIQDDVNDNEMHANIKQHTLKICFRWK